MISKIFIKPFDHIKYLMLPNIPIIQRNASNKNCPELNFLQKNSLGAYVCLLRSEAKGLPRLPSSKYFNVQKWESSFTLDLDAARNAHYIKKCFQ